MIKKFRRIKKIFRPRRDPKIDFWKNLGPSMPPKNRKNRKFRRRPKSARSGRPGPPKPEKLKNQKNFKNSKIGRRCVHFHIACFSKFHFFFAMGSAETPCLRLFIPPKKLKKNRVFTGLRQILRRKKLQKFSKNVKKWSKIESAINGFYMIL